MTGAANQTGGFTHLEVHSHFTLLGATPGVDELVDRAGADGFTHLALTDTNALYGSVRFHQACLREDVQPIIGMAVSVAAPPEAPSSSSWQPGHMVLLAKGPVGFRSLCRISSAVQGSPHREAIAARGVGWELIASNAEDLICLSGGRRSWIERLIRLGRQEGASREAARIGGVFGENACLSLEIHSPEDVEVAQEVENLGHRFGLVTVAVQPVYYLAPGDWTRIRLLAAVQANTPLDQLNNKNPFHEVDRDLCWLRPDEVATRFERFPGAISRAGQVAAKCQPSLPDGRPIWPVLDLPQGKSPAQLLAELAGDGLTTKYGPSPPAPVQERLKKELAAIDRTGYTPLFIIVADIVRFARDTAVPVSTRGSVANSLVAYCTGITTVDPIAHDLLFERFLNPARSTPPDIDLDFCSRRRDEILAYVRQKYGEDHVALVATISTLRPKSAVRETGKALGLDEAEIDQLARSLPRGWHPDPRRRSRRSVDDLLAELEDPRHKEVIIKAYELIGQPHHLSVHPGGLVITPGPLTDYVPVQLAPKGFLITQFDHLSLESLGLPKLDLLGISALTVMADTVELINQHGLHAPSLSGQAASNRLPRSVFRLEDIPLDDKATGELLESGETIGVFQCESAGAQRTLRQLKARTVPDLAVANAFFKPGPATGGMAQAFIRRYRGEEEVSYLHPALEPILSPTKGVLLFQEQILRVATEIARLDWEQANQLRRGMSKFRADEMKALKADFLKGCTGQPPDGAGFQLQQAQVLWEQVMAFAGYGFNQGHATAYADVSYRSAYLKTRWPAAFFCARLADWGGFHHPAVYEAEAIRLGIANRPPHVNHSHYRYTLSFAGLSPTTGDPVPVLWMGLGQVRDLRRSSADEIIHRRNDKPFDSLEDLLERVPLQTKEVTHLIQCGALDGLGPDRATLLAEADDIYRAGSTRQMAFQFNDKPDIPPESTAQRLEWEQHILGRPISVHPLDLVDHALNNTTSIGDLPATRGKLVSVAGVRLPGWTGGPGFFLADRTAFIVARLADGQQTPKTWQPLQLQGRLRLDEWGSRWLQVETIRSLLP